MKDTLKAVLLSGLVFPGLGQLIQKRYRLAIPLMLVTLGGLLVIVVVSIRQALTVVEQIQSRGLIDLADITDAATRAAAGANTPGVNLATGLVVVCWLVGIIDAWLSGRKRERLPTDPGSEE